MRYEDYLGQIPDRESYLVVDCNGDCPQCGYWNEKLHDCQVLIKNRAIQRRRRENK